MKIEHCVIILLVSIVIGLATIANTLSDILEVLSK